MKKIYISGKITGLDLDVAKRSFDNAKKEVEQMGFTPVSPFDLKHDKNESWHEYMRTDIKALVECDYLYLMNNFITSKGAKLELEIANRIGLEIIRQ